MTYEITNSAGQVLTEIPDGTFDVDTTSLTLIGRNVTNFGESINENFVKLLESFASPNPPEQAITGQLWYDTSSQRLHLYNGTQFKAAGGPYVSSVVPQNMIAGDLWINNDTNQMWFYDGSDLVLAGPIYTAAQKTTGFVSETVLDIYNIGHTICKLYVGEVLLGIFSKDTFRPKDSINGFLQNTDILAGFNVASLTGFKFNVIASQAETILDEEGVPKTASEFALTTAANVFSETFTVQNNNALVLGASEQVLVNLVNDALHIEHQQSNKDIALRVKTNGVTNDAVFIDGANKRVGIFESAPSSTLDVAGDVNIAGNLVVRGETVTVNSETLVVKDKNIELGASDAPTDLLANAGGITLRGTTNKTMLYNSTTDCWDFSIPTNVPTGSAVYIGGNNVLTESTLGSSVVNSSLTTVGKLKRLDLDRLIVPGEPPINGITLLGNSVQVEGDLVLKPTAAINVSGKVVTGAADPNVPSDLTNKRYVDNKVYSRDISMSMDVTGLSTNADIIAILNEIAPLVDTTTTPVAHIGTKLRLHTTRTVVTTGMVDPQPLLKSTIAVGAGTLVLQDVNTEPVQGPTANVSVIRQNKVFVRAQNTWVFESESAEYTT